MKSIAMAMAACAWVLGASAHAATPVSPAGDLNGGIWRVQIKSGDVRPLLGGRLPPLLPAALAAYRDRLAAKAGDRGKFDTMERCNAPGVPRLLLQGRPFEFLQRDDLMLVHYEWNRLLRVVEMNVEHSEVAGPLLLGQSVGRWEGRTLVIDSNGFTDTTLLDDSGRVAGPGISVS